MTGLAGIRSHACDNRQHLGQSGLPGMSRTTSGFHKTSETPGLDVTVTPYGFDNEMLNDSTSLLHDHDDWHR